MKCKLFLVSVLAVIFAVPSAAGAETRLSYSCFFPPTHVQSKLAEAWCQEVETRTEGRVVVDYYPGGTLTKAPQAYDGVVQGISDLGFSVLGYTRGLFPVMAAVDLPLGYESGKTATRVANGVYEKFSPSEFDNVKVMYFHAHGPGLLHTAKQPVEKLEDLQGLKIRATGNSGQLVKALGGTPVAMSMSDSYQSIQKGVVDGGMYPLETNKGWNMAEVVDYCTKSHAVAYTTTFFVVMNKDRWESLDPEVQEIITKINQEWAPRHGQAWDESDVVGREFFLENGGEFISLSQQEEQRWESAAAPLLKEYAADAESKGLPGRQIVDFIVETLEQEQ
ncbi:MAG: TRAP transporter substrate-binding protein [Desulfohalobiaceae bacterium]